MAYIPFNEDKPVIIDDGDDVISQTRENLIALRDAIVSGGMLRNWGMTVTGGAPSAPTQITYTKGTETITLDIIWLDNNPVSVTYTYDVLDIGTLLLVYSAGGYLLSQSWGTGTAAARETAIPFTDDALDFSVSGGDVWIKFGGSDVAVTVDDTSQRFLVQTEGVNKPDGVTHWMWTGVQGTAQAVNYEARTTFTGYGV